MSATETELKLALPGLDSALLARRLARVPALARTTPMRERLTSIYHDTPALDLLRQRVALRLRREGEGDGKGAKARWLQTLKTAGDAASALSQRGEWEMPVAGPALEPAQLAGTPWAALDPQGEWAAALQPCFTTDFERTRWRLRVRGGAVIEVALDVGAITATVDGAQRSAPLCELELELVQGPPEALLALARRIARHVAVLPLAASKAERGYALLQPPASPAVTASPPPLARRMTVAQVAERVLGEAFQQFCANLFALQQGSDAPEVVHQARVGWRRLRSLVRLFAPACTDRPAPAAAALAPLLQPLGRLRDLDVASTQTLPALAAHYAQGDEGRAAAWQSAQDMLAAAAQQTRGETRAALQQPAVGAALLAWQDWLHGWSLAAQVAPGVQACTFSALAAEPARHWARQRIRRLVRKLAAALETAGDDEALHHARILAKRLRYGSTALAPLLPQRMTRHRSAAEQWQERLGAQRDWTQAGALVAAHGGDAAVAAFLRGAAVGRGWAGVRAGR
ncbi:CHAD domain-containing protein [Diaphorobacter sp.]|uniref:CYTH and CHAD domain-containing protein n=1 Tax=Diaphorobacter sp. TaxID=1934310 RepID=UPI003D142FD7